MKKKCLMILFLLAGTISSFSQQSTDSTAIKLTDKLKVDLELNSSQYQQVLSENKIFVKNLQQIKNSDSGKFKKLKGLKKINDQRTKNFKQILTLDQFKKFEALQAENRKKMKEFKK